MYKIIGADKKEYGPVSAEVIRQWITGRRANDRTLIQAEGSTEWRPLSSFPEFRAALTAGAPPPLSPTGTPPMVPSASAPPKKNGLAVASMVLGIASLACLPVLPAIGAIITGMMARKRARQDSQLCGGEGMALAGLIMGCVGLVLPLLFIVAVTLPKLTEAKGKAQSIMCVNNLKQITLAARLWSNDHQDVFPPDFKSMSNELPSAAVLVCPGDKARVGRPQRGTAVWEPGNITYLYLAPGLKEDVAVQQREIFRCPIHGHVALGDGSVRQGR